MEFDIYDMDTKKSLVENAIMPLSPKASLEWVGFTDGGLPVSFDSAGILRGAFKNNSYRWVPLLDTRPLRDGKQDYYWPVSVIEESFHMVICKVMSQPQFWFHLDSGWRKIPSHAQSNSQ
jgi:chromosome transmission fidelity protein 4